LIDSSPVDCDWRELLIREAESNRFERNGCAFLFDKVCKMLGLVFSMTTISAIGKPQSMMFRFQRPFDETDLEDMKESVKHMNIVSHSEGFLLKMKGSTKREEESRRLYLLAIDCFKKALVSDPNNKNSLRNLAECLMQIERHLEARFYYLRAIDSDPSDSISLFKYACFLDKLGDCDLAEEYYLRSLESDPYNGNALCVYADFLAYCRRDLVLAEQLYACAVRSDLGNPYLLNNFACFLLRFLKEKLDLADYYFREAIDCDGNIPIIYRNYSVLLELEQQRHQMKKYFNLYKQKQKRLRSISMRKSMET